VDGGIWEEVASHGMFATNYDNHGACLVKTQSMAFSNRIRDMLLSRGNTNAKRKEQE